MLKLLPPTRTLSPVASRTISSSSESLSMLPSKHTDVIQKLLECKTVSRSLKVFRNSYKNPEIYSAIIHIITRDKRYPQATCLMKELIENLRMNKKNRHIASLAFNALQGFESSKFTPGVFDVLILALSQMGLVEEACWVYKKTKALPGIQACHSLLHGFVKLSNFDSMWKFYDEMVSRGIASNVVTYDTLINACCKQGDILKACKLFNEMVEKKIDPTVVVYTSVISGLCKEGMITEALDVFGLMEKSGMSPNLYTYNVLIDCYCKIENINQALALYSQMQVQNVQPNVITFSTLIDGLCKAGNISEAFFLFSEMGKVSISPDIFTYGILMKGLCEMARVTEATDLFHKMEKEDGYCKEKNMEAAMGLYSEMVIKGLVPGVITFTTLIHGQLKAGNLKKASRLQNEMKERGISPNAFTLGCSVDGLCKDGGAPIKLLKAKRDSKGSQEDLILPN
ncbi:hypothetical protein C5167_005882 [Papaver somniferum]|uniref:Pentacotripeptide-repeat region of PRORP domain-containing protein n=1 Tax=Papaver somniferum TaxID=3469 RepID=A0A4Y7JDH3_PAPSO|nr:hypothetical protein C5167_005882 [Papaver somniferum]